MKKIKILLFTITGVAVFTYVLGTISWDAGIFQDAALSYLGKKFQKEISADSLKIAFLKEIEITGLKVSGEDGFGFFAGKLKVDYNLLKLFSEGLVAECAVKDVRVFRKNFTFLKPVSELFLISQPSGELRFQNVYTDIYLENKTFIPKNLEAVGRNIKVYGDGAVSSEKIIDYELKFLLAPRGLGSTLNVFEIFKGLVLGGEESGWISLSFRIKGKVGELRIVPTQ